MSRTTHHSSPAHRLSWRLGGEDYAYYVSPAPAPEPDGDAYTGAPGAHSGVHTWHESATLRYPASETGRTDGRPRPTLVRRRFASYSYVRTWYADRIDVWCGLLEVVARARTRGALTDAVGTANALLREGNLDFDAWDGPDFDIAPTRHRGNARWQAL